MMMMMMMMAHLRLALFPNSSFELIVGFDECNPLKV